MTYQSIYLLCMRLVNTERRRREKERGDAVLRYFSNRVLNIDIVLT